MSRSKLTVAWKHKEREIVLDGVKHSAGEEFAGCVHGQVECQLEEAVTPLRVL